MKRYDKSYIKGEIKENKKKKYSIHKRGYSNRTSRGNKRK